MKRCASVPVLLGAIAVISCGEPTSEVVISVDTDLGVPSELDEIRFVAMRADRAAIERSVRVSASDELPVELGLVHDGGPLGPVNVRVVGLLGGEEIVERRMQFDFVRGRVLLIRVELSRACVGVECADGETCASGVCREIRLRPDELLPWMHDAGTGCGLESCNDLDDDCDGLVDEGFDLTSDDANCGGCGQRCVVGPGSAGAVCIAGTCELECLSEMGNCDGDADNGCETRLDVVEHCGECGRSCARFEAESTCNAGRCELLACAPGQRDCDTNPDNGCESALNDTTNCGGCGIPCALFNAVETCGSGVCTLSSCESGHDNCDGRSENGCEADVHADVFHCGACSRRCEADVPNAADVCVDGTCEDQCHAGWADCDGIAANGCETNLSLPASCGSCDIRCTGLAYLCSGAAESGYSCVPPPCMDPPTRCGESCVNTTLDARHCGGCDVVCPSGANAAPICIASGCQLACDPGYGDCDGDPANGCEVPLNDPLNCGGCGRECALAGAVAACTGGSCLVAGCDPGFADCNGLAPDGCERSTTSLFDCGGCGMTCTRDNAVADCGSSSCVIGACEPGWGDCDGIDGNGCETPLGPCDTCAGTCVLPHASSECRVDTCALTACDARWGDCDADPTNGCELELVTTDDCGACGEPCVVANGVASCAGGTCAIGGCDPGYADCDGDPDNGCEVDLGSDETCGSCDNVCGVSETCASGACRGEFDLVTIDAGDRHSCGLTATGRGYCWGEGSDGRLGQGEWADSLVPVAVDGLNNAISISAGVLAACAVRSGGVVTCWGSNLYGQLAEVTIAENRPRNTAITDAVSVVLGGEHACALRRNGRVLCWGRNSRGQIGNGATSAFPVAPTDPGMSQVVQIDAGWRHTCALRANGDVYCWGDNAEGQLGDGTRDIRTMPVRVSLARASWVSTGTTSSGAVVDGVVWTWGDNSEGQLGDGTTVGSSTPLPLDIAGAEAIHVGRGHACACLGSAVWCWGDNEFGQLGDGTMLDSLLPQLVPGIGAGQLDVGVDHACHVDASDVWCWGRNDAGQLGDDSTVAAPSPVGVGAPPTM